MKVAARWTALEALREVAGPPYGSEDLAVLLYALVRRERPRAILELGTGLGVSTAWMAHALDELGCGRVWTVDDASHFSDNPTLRSCATQIAQRWAGRAYEAGSYGDYLSSLWEHLGLADQVTFVHANLRFGPRRALTLPDALPEQLDWIFSDFAYGEDAVTGLLAAVLPRLSPNASVFIDSASGHAPTRRLLEGLAESLASGEIPAEIGARLSRVEASSLRGLVDRSKVTLVDLFEAKDRAQNNTAWLQWRRRHG